MKLDYIKKIDGTNRIITQKEAKTNSTIQLLEDNYPDILESMKNEHHKIEYDEFEVFQELISNNKEIIGFITITYPDNSINCVCINEIYIIPKFRHNGYFFETLLNLISQPNIRLSIKHPSYSIIERLLKYNLAKKLSNNLVYSYIDFDLEDVKIYKNKQIRNHYDSMDYFNENMYTITNLYDLNINSPIIINFKDIESDYINPIYILTARKIDSNRTDYYKKLKNVDLIYLDLLLNQFLTKLDEIPDFHLSIENLINQYLNPDDILGTNEELNNVFEYILEKNNLTKDDGFKIRKDVIKALFNNEITHKSIILRTLYLIEHYHDKPTNDIKNNQIGNDLIEPCPYCKHLNPNILDVCSKCGYNIQLNNSFTEKLIEQFEYDIDSFEEPFKLKDCYNKKNPLLFTNETDIQYLNYDNNYIYQKYCGISTYQFLSDIKDVLYIDLFNYDLLYGIREGSTIKVASDRGFIKELKDYTKYYELMENSFSMNKLIEIMDNNVIGNETREELLHKIKVELSPLEIFGKKYVITKKGRKYLLENKYMQLYLEEFPMFNFIEFENYYKKHSIKNIKKNFIKHIEKLAKKYNSYDKYKALINYKYINSDENDDNEFIEIFLIEFILELSNWLTYHISGDGIKAINNELFRKYPLIKESIKDTNINKLLNSAFEYFNEDMIIKYGNIIEFYFKKTLIYGDLEDINRELEYEIETKEYIDSLLY